MLSPTSTSPSTAPDGRPIGREVAVTSPLALVIPIMPAGGGASAASNSPPPTGRQATPGTPQPPGAAVRAVLSAPAILGSFLAQLLAQQPDEATARPAPRNTVQAAAAYQTAAERGAATGQAANDLYLPGLPPPLASGHVLDLTV